MSQFYIMYAFLYFKPTMFDSTHILGDFFVWQFLFHISDVNWTPFEICFLPMRVWAAEPTTLPGGVALESASQSYTDLHMFTKISKQVLGSSLDLVEILFA